MHPKGSGSVTGVMATAFVLVLVLWIASQNSGFTSRASMESSVGGYVERRYR